MRLSRSNVVVWLSGPVMVPYPVGFGPPLPSFVQPSSGSGSRTVTNSPTKFLCWHWQSLDCLDAHFWSTWGDYPWQRMVNCYRLMFFSTDGAKCWHLDLVHVGLCCKRLFPSSLVLTSFKLTYINIGRTALWCLSQYREWLIQLSTKKISFWDY